MKSFLGRSLFTGLLLSFLSFLPVRAEVTVPTRPKLVTVFPDGARVTREGSFLFSPGSHKALFPDLPASLIDSSLRLSVEGPKGTRFYGISFRKTFTPEIVEARTRELRAKIQALQDQRTDLSDAIEAAKAEMEILKNLAKQSSETAVKQGPGHPGTISDFTLSAAAVGKRIAALSLANRKDERAIRDLDLKIAALNQELAQSGNEGREARVAEADLELPESGTVKFTLAYQVEGASWSPLYDMKLNTSTEKPKVDLAFNAQVRQTTGEDWKNVSLTLSTSRPTEGTEVPDPTDWWLDFLTAQFNEYKSLAKRKVGLAQRAMAPELASGDASMAEKDEVAPASMPPAQVIQSAYAMDFVVPVRKDIPSDGSEHRVGIAEDRHQVDLTLVAVPRLSQAAFLEAKVTYGGEQTLLPGAVQLFRDGDFAGTSFLNAKAPGEAVTLGFGQDDSIRVERKLIKTETGKGGFIFTKGERKYHWATTVANYHGGARTVEVREQLPRSAQKDIKVEVLEMSPKPLKEREDKPGLKVWALSLAPKEKGKVTFSYKVNFPEGTQVSGLE